MKMTDPHWFPMIGSLTDIEKLADAIHNEYVNRADVKVSDVEEILRLYRSEHVAKAVTAGVEDFSSGLIPLQFRRKLIQMILSRLETGESLDD